MTAEIYYFILNWAGKNIRVTTDKKIITEKGEIIGQLKSRKNEKTI